jgi:RNA polymerase sigma factor (sigma-70 family)
MTNNSQPSVKVEVLQAQNENIEQVILRERGRLLNFIKSRIPDDEDAEDVLQDVFFQLTQTHRLMKPVEKMSSWLFTVARNKIADLFRKNKPVNFSKIDRYAFNDEEDDRSLANLLPSTEPGPEGEFLREMTMQTLEEALDELPEEQRYAFVSHEFEGKSFKELSAESGETVNTWLSRKRYAVLHLRSRLQDLYQEIKEL